MKVFDKPIIIQTIDEKSEEWIDIYYLHSRVNKSKSNNQYLEAGSTRTQATLTFEIRYFKEVKNIKYSMQNYRIKYDDVIFAIEDYDDYLEQHKTVKFVGVSY